MYADDTTLYSNIDSPNQNNMIRLTETKINAELAKIDEWLKINKLSLTLSYSPIWNQNVPQEIPFFIRNQYSVIARKKSKTTAIISRVKI